LRVITGQIVLGDELAQDDDLIISKRSVECPEDDEDDCVYDVQTNNKDSLIYPVTVITTRKPRQYVRTALSLSLSLSVCVCVCVCL